MDIVGTAMSIVSLAQIIISICTTVRETYKSDAGFDSTFDSTILDAEVQVQRLVSWGEVFRAEPCSPHLSDLLGRVLGKIDVEIKAIQGYIEKYVPDRDNVLRSRLVPKSSVDSSLLSPDPIHTQNTDSKSKKKGPSIIKKFKYVISDKDNLLSHSALLEKAIDQLHALIPPNGQLLLKLNLLATLLETDDIDKLSVIASSTGCYSYRNIQASATIKAIRIQAEIASRTSDETSNVLVCDLDDFDADRHWEGKQIGIYKERKVLVEWKTCSDELSIGESIHRIAGVARLLHQTGITRPRDLITPDCLGYFVNENKPLSMGIVYALPSTYSEGLPRSLFQLLAEKGTDPSLWPSLDQRRNLARVLARAVFQLHVVGWLHKGIRPQNIMFIGENRYFETPYLIGFDYARKEGYEEKTESTDLAFNLYRHPSAQGEVRSRFEASFDLFALGLILLEVGIWDSLQNQREALRAEYNNSSHDAQNKFHSLLVNGNGPVKHLQFHMGDKYYNAVKTCLSANSRTLTKNVYITDIIANLAN